MSEGRERPLPDYGKNIFICQSFNGLKVWQNKNTFSQMLKKAVQQGRSE